MRQPLALYRQSFSGRCAFDAAVSRALLHAVGRGGRPAGLRLYRPDDVLAFSVFDRTRPGFARAVVAAQACGFEPIVRLAGGRAAVFHRDTVAFAWSVPAEDPRVGIRERFDEMASIVCAALERLGVDARIGAVPGEYCPGDHSVNARGRVKLAGVGQRIVRGAAHVGGVVVARGTARTREALRPVYRELGFDFDPDTVGSVEDEVGAVDCEAVIEALLDEFGRRYEIEPRDLPAAELSTAADLEAQHRLAE